VFVLLFLSCSNHFTTKVYHDELLEKLGVSLKRPPEFPLQVAAKEDCSRWGQTMYGKPNGWARYIAHLDGSNVNITITEEKMASVKNTSIKEVASS
jgi:hypothetical protein